VKKNILIVCGGGGSEHEISLVSANYIQEKLLSLNKYNVHLFTLTKDFKFLDKSKNEYHIDESNSLVHGNNKIKIDYAIPCIHGYPGETGDIQSYFEMIQLPYLGAGPEASKICFNKVTTKLWLEGMGIDTTPFIYLSEIDMNKVIDFHNKNGPLFLKPSNQGSSVGCHKINEIGPDTKTKIEEAFTLGPYALIEQALNVRELEVSVFEFNGDIHVSSPGEILPPQDEKSFYTYEEKYNKDSQTKTMVEALNLTKEQLDQIKTWALKAFKELKVKNMARVDFFLTDQGKVYLNEINTFPGLTPISMFPKMMENYGVNFQGFLQDTIDNKLS